MPIIKKRKKVTAATVKELIATEDQEQHFVTRWMDYRKITYIHVPNGGKRSLYTGSKLKLAGVKAGFPDLIIFDKPPNFPLYRGVAIEMKKKKGGVTSPLQKEWIEKLKIKEWFATVCHGADEAIKTLTDLGF